MYKSLAVLYNDSHGKNGSQRSSGTTLRGGGDGPHRSGVPRALRPACSGAGQSRTVEVLIEALEDAEDAQAFDAAMAEEGPNIPWDEVKADLGWT